MKKNFILTGILLSIFLFTCVAFAQLTDWEKRVYYDLLETSYFSSKKFDDIYAEVASRHGTTVERVKTIWDKALDDEPTEWEWKVFDDLDERLMSLPKGSSNETRKRIYQEVAAKYGITLIELYSIDDRCLMWFYW